MNRRMLATRSTHDKANNYLYSFTEQIIKEAESKGWKVDSMDAGKNTRSELESRLKKNKPNLIIANGHGNDKQLCGHKNEVILDEHNIQLTADVVVFTRSCNSLAGLGKNAVEKGCKSFIGYRGKFLLPRVREWEAKPLGDPAAAPVLDVSNTVPLSLLKGASTEEAVQNCHYHANKLIIKMLTTEEPYYNAALRALVHNDRVLGFEGDSDARGTD